MICAFGEVRQYNNEWVMVHPEYQLQASDAPLEMEEHLTPIYPSTQGLTQNRLRHLIKIALTHLEPVLNQLEWLSEDQRIEYNLNSLGEAIQYIHFPPPHLMQASIESGTNHL